MTGIRYEFSKNADVVGILTGLDDYFTFSEIWSIYGIFEDKLPKPNVCMENTKSFFTIKGNKKFRKAIRKISHIADKKDIKVIKTIEEISKKSIIYSDKYQIIIANKEVAR